MAFSTAYGTALVANLFNGVAIPAAYTGTNLYAALHTADPGVGGTQTTNETSYGSYGRQAIVRNTTGAWTCSGKTASNAAACQFPAASSGTPTLTHMSLGELSTGAGAIALSGPISPTIVIATGVQPNFPIGSIVATYT